MVAVLSSEGMSFALLPLWCWLLTKEAVEFDPKLDFFWPPLDSDPWVVNTLIKGRLLLVLKAFLLSKTDGGRGLGVPKSLDEAA